ATVHVQVTPVNDPPVAIPADYTIDEDTSLAFRLAGMDVETPQSALTFVYFFPPDAPGRVTGTAPALVYIPPRNFHGTVAFPFGVLDTGDGPSPAMPSPPATVTIHVLP